MIEMRSLADEFPDDVERMKTCLHAAGRTWTDDDVVLAWSDYSDNWCAVTDCYVAKLIPAKDSSGDVWLLVPDDAMHAAGWRIGDELEVERQGDTLVLRRLTNKAKK
jgi:hypothetical protein